MSLEEVYLCLAFACIQGEILLRMHNAALINIRLCDNLRLNSDDIDYPTMRFLFLSFIILPLIEIIVLIQMGQLVGVQWTIALVVLTAFVGIHMLRQQGRATLNRANWRRLSGEFPAKEMLEGIFLAIGGALLLTPGFITDTFGFMCLLPFTRAWMVSKSTGKMRVFIHRKFSTNADDKRDSNIIEGEFDTRPNRDIS